MFSGFRSLLSVSPAAACPRRGGVFWENLSVEDSGVGVSSTRHWLVDSGSAWDLVDASHVRHLKDIIRTPQYCPRLWTANSITSVEKEVPLYVPELDEGCVPFVLKDTPDVLAMGRRCMNEG